MHGCSHLGGIGGILVHSILASLDHALSSCFAAGTDPLNGIWTKLWVDQRLAIPRSLLADQAICQPACERLADYGVARRRQQTALDSNCMRAWVSLLSASRAVLAAGCPSLQSPTPLSQVRYCAPINTSRREHHGTGTMSLPHCWTIPEKVNTRLM